MDYVSVEEGRKLPGLRLVLSPGSPNPWAEGAKAIFHLKGLAYVAVAQQPGMPNEALQAWTGQTSSPVAILDDEKPRPPVEPDYSPCRAPFAEPAACSA